MISDDAAYIHPSLILYVQKTFCTVYFLTALSLPSKCALFYGFKDKWNTELFNSH